MTNKSEIQLRKSVIADLDILFTFQVDPEANYQAAFTSKDPTDKAAYLDKYQKHFQDPAINNQTILVDGVIAGSIARFVLYGDNEITYWIDKKYWGTGVGTRALTQFLTIETTRPLYGRTAFDNFGSQRVLEKCGFIKVGTDKGFANARQAEIEEFIYRLDQ